MLCPGRIRHGTQNVKTGTNPERFAHRRHVSHGGMIDGSKHKGHVTAFHALYYLMGCQIDLDAECFSPRERAFLQACQDLYDRREILEDTWRALIELATEVEIIELCMLVGHYQMLAMTLNTLRVPLDAR